MTLHQPIDEPGSVVINGSAYVRTGPANSTWDDCPRAVLVDALLSDQTTQTLVDRGFLDAPIEDIVRGAVEILIGQGVRP